MGNISDERKHAHISELTGTYVEGLANLPPPGEHTQHVAQDHTGAVDGAGTRASHTHKCGTAMARGCGHWKHPSGPKEIWEHSPLTSKETQERKERVTNVP